MAATTSPTSPWAETYSDKSDDWVKARLESFEEKEKLSVAGSITRRQEIRKLRVELKNRKAAAELTAAAGAASGDSSMPLAVPAARVAAGPRLS